MRKLGQISLSKTAAAVVKHPYAIGLPEKGKFAPLPKITGPALTETVIQLHKADRAGKHFDLRLQIPKTERGASWAIPSAKLPKPGESVLAVRQGDHTLDYFDWEGKIEKGYGKGKVDIHHRGKAEIIEARPDLIRFGMFYETQFPQTFLLRQGEKNDWYLMNTTPHKDRVKLPEGKPKYKEVTDLKNKKTVEEAEGVVQAKIDGSHALLHFNNSGWPRLFSYRESKKNPTGLIEHTQKVEEINNLGRMKNLANTLLRGEIWGRDSKGNPLRPEIIGGLLNSNVFKSREDQETKGKLIFSPFDAVKVEGKNVEKAPYNERLQAVQELAKKLDLELPDTAATPKQKKTLWQRIRSGNHPQTSEGVVVWSDAGTPTKAKLRPDYDGKITGFFASEPGSKYDKKGVGGFYIRINGVESRVGTGLSDALRKDMHSNPKKYLGLVASVTAQEQLPSGKLRAASFERFHTDKNEPSRLAKVL